VLHGLLYGCRALFHLHRLRAETGPINEFGHDVVLLLMVLAALEWASPYRDFYLALGPLEYMIMPAYGTDPQQPAGIRSATQFLAL